ncbi:histidinol-phosphatase HisJ family protein [Natroniella sulfidigena]|uniref:histidinol-phosphatase HisJ family protein n=1 Tax=Natroniella sulfidigena TaxID=723921 RepID=UPI00200A9128|nr:histidinol-phosphatase HisJ family protein [Natroniella sulfidigena]MCK8817915.1 histidinol-phosphatase HisJ family protein [Natroniella sulfidigena]
MLVDYHIHPLGHQDRAMTAKNLKGFMEEAVKKGIAEIGFADHNRYYQQFDFELIRQVAEDFSELKVRAGIEMDYTPGEELEIKDFLEQFELDYVIGSIHYLDGWMFDHPDYKAEYQNWDLAELYQTYFNYIKQAAQSGLFDFLGHLDLIKIFNFKPEGNILEIVAPVLEVIAENDLAIEINTNGLNKPVGEFYPSKKILERAYQLEIPVTLSSDAHIAQRVGENLTEVRDLLRGIGYREVATFKSRERKMVEL